MALGTAGDVDIGGILLELSQRRNRSVISPFGYRSHVTWWGKILFNLRLRYSYPRPPYPFTLRR